MDVSGQLHPQGKSSRYPLYRRLGGTQSRSGRGGEEKNSQPPPPGIQTLEHRPSDNWIKGCGYRSRPLGLESSCDYTE
jgi:hypothetical protein